MDPLTKALFFVFISGSMLGIGLKVGKDEILSVVRDKNWFARTLLVNFVLIPAAGYLLAIFLVKKPETALALIVLACAPGGVSALQFLSKKRDAAALAYGGGTAVVLSFLSIFITPLLISLVIPAGMTLTVPYGKAILFVSLFFLLPLVLGILVRGAAEPVANMIAGPVSLIATLAFVGGMVKLFQLMKWARGEMGTASLLAIVAFILVSMLFGWLLGGPRKFTRQVLATAGSMRNGALGMAIAVRSFDLAVLTPLIAFFAIMVPLNMLYLFVSKALEKKAEKRAAAR